MLIRIENTPKDVSEEEIMALFNHSPRVELITFQRDSSEKAALTVWVRLNVDSRAVLNGIADYLNGRHLRGSNIKVTAPLFFNAPRGADTE